MIVVANLPLKKDSFRQANALIPAQPAYSRNSNDWFINPEYHAIGSADCFLEKKASQLPSN